MPTRVGLLALPLLGACGGGALELAAVDLEDLDGYDTAGRRDVVTLADFVAARIGAILGVGDDGACTAERR